VTKNGNKWGKNRNSSSLRVGGSKEIHSSKRYKVKEKKPTTGGASTYWRKMRGATGGPKWSVAANEEGDKLPREKRAGWTLY